MPSSFRRFFRNHVYHEVRDKDREGQKVKGGQYPEAVGDESANRGRKSGKEGLNAEKGAYGRAADVFGRQVHGPGKHNRAQREEEKTQERQRPYEQKFELKNNQGDKEEASDQKSGSQHGTPPFFVG